MPKSKPVTIETSIEPLPKLPDLRGDVATIPAQHLAANWRAMAGEPDLCAGVLWRAVLLAHAVKHPSIRKRWCDESGEPGEILLQACASLSWKFQSKKDLDERLRRVNHRCRLIRAGKARNPPITALTPALEAELAAEAERLDAIADGFVLDINLDLLGPPADLTP